MIIVLTVPFVWNRTVLNAGECVGLPDAIAQTLLDAGQARQPDDDIVTDAVERPPAHRRMHPKVTKAIA